MLEYRLRWKVDEQGNFEKWEKPQLLGDYKIFGVSFKSTPELKPIWQDGKIAGFWIKSDDENEYMI